MEFALKQIKGMGWSEGKGLGRSEDGIKAPIKPTTQMDTRGLGFYIEDSMQLKNHWWSDAYNAAAKGLKSEYKITSLGVVVKTKQIPTSEEKDEKCEKKKSLYNNRFVSAGFMEKHNNLSELTECNEASSDKESKMINRKRKCTLEDKREEENKSDEPKMIDFNDVFQRCKGMTCHKAARLGIKMNGKMKRIEEQEQNFLKKKIKK